jgi:hypothetical protein
MAADRFAPQSDEELQALLEDGDSSNKKKECTCNWNGEKNTA